MRLRRFLVCSRCSTSREVPANIIKITEKVVSPCCGVEEFEIIDSKPQFEKN